MAISPKSRVYCSIDLSADGKPFGELQLRHSTNRQSLGYYPVSINSIVNGGDMLGMVATDVQLPSELSW